MSLAGTSTQVAPVTSRDTQASDLGYYFSAITPTPGTGIIGHAINTTFVETKPMFLLYNGGNANIYPMFLKLTNTAVSVGNTMTQFTVTLDQGNRFSSGGTALLVANNNINSGNQSGAQITVGAVTATAATAPREIQRPFTPEQEEDNAREAENIFGAWLAKRRPVEEEIPV